MNKRYNINDVYEFCEELGLECKSTEYKSVSSKLTFVCTNCGENFERTFDKLMRSKSTTCSNCGKRKAKNTLKYEEVKQYIEIDSNSNCKLLQDYYISAKDKLKLKCSCGNVFYTTLNKFKSLNKRQCNDCGKKIRIMNKKLKISDVKNMVKEIGYTFIKFVDDPSTLDSKTKFQIRCKNDHEYTTTYNNIQQGKRCGLCRGRNKTTEMFKAEVYEKTNGEYELLSEYTDSSTYVIIHHHTCGNDYKVKPNNFISGHRCPHCNFSKGEKQIETYLMTHNVTNITQYRFDDCRNVLPLPFDFAIFKNNELVLLIEYDGKQHFEPVNYGRLSDEDTLENFKYIQHNDNIKNTYCKENNISLLRIPYWEFDNIEQILHKEFSNYELIF